MTPKIETQAILNRVKGTQDNSASNQIKQNNATTQTGKSFESVLQKIQERSVVVSKHAAERLTNRSVTLTEAELKRIGEVMEKAQAKGIRDAVIIIDDKILVANIPNKTIVTAAKKGDLGEHIISNINGAIVL